MSDENNDRKQYRSSVLLCHDPWTDYGIQIKDDHCPVCRFLSGSRDPADMISTIAALDSKLAGTEECAQRLTAALDAAVGKIKRLERDLAAALEESESNMLYGQQPID